MPCQCCAVGLDEIFGDRVARHEARRFRKKGLSVRSRRLLDAIRSAIPLEGSTACEVGAGVGGLTITMLQDGLANAHIVDAVPVYVAFAGRLAREYDVADRLEIELADYVARARDLGPVDLVAMDRVICCYPVWRDLLEAATAHAGRVIALTYPRDRLWVRVAIGVINFFQRIRRKAFRVYVHPPAGMHRLLFEHGFQPDVTGHHGPWEVMVAVRTA